MSFEVFYDYALRHIHFDTQGRRRVFGAKNQKGLLFMLHFLGTRTVAIRERPRLTECLGLLARDHGIRFNEIQINCNCFSNLHVDDLNKRGFPTTLIGFGNYANGELFYEKENGNALLEAPVALRKKWPAHIPHTLYKRIWRNMKLRRNHKKKGMFNGYRNEIRVQRTYRHKIKKGTMIEGNVVPTRYQKAAFEGSKAAHMTLPWSPMNVEDVPPRQRLRGCERIAVVYYVKNKPKIHLTGKNARPEAFKAARRSTDWLHRCPMQPQLFYHHPPPPHDLPLRPHTLHISCVCSYVST